MGLRKGETVEVTVDRMAFGGHGVARVQEFVVFVRGAVAGDRVRARIYKKRGTMPRPGLKNYLSLPRTG